MKLVGICGYVPNNLLDEIKNHPMRGGRTQNEMYEYIFEIFTRLTLEFFQRLADEGKASKEELLTLESWKKRVKAAENCPQEPILCPRCQTLTTITSLDDMPDFGFKILNLKCRHSVFQTVPDPQELQNLGPQPEQPSQGGEETRQQCMAPVGPAVPIGNADARRDVVGDSIASLLGGDHCEVGGSSFVDLRWQVQDGRVFVERVKDFPRGEMGSDYCRHALGLEPVETIVQKLPELLGRQVQVRRVRKQGGDGIWRIKTYYYPVARIRLIAGRR